MPPKSFKSLVIAVSGAFPGYKQADLKAIVEGQGATFSTSVKDDCTHLVTTEKEIEKGTTKYKQACAISSCEIVSLDWLLGSDKAKKPLPGKAYLLGSTQTPSKQDSKKNGDTTQSTKRKRDADGTATVTGNGANKKQKDAQKAASKTLNIPVDEACTLSGQSVYIDDSGIIWDATLNQTNSANNNNKFYRIQLLVGNNGASYKTWTRWGRVGETGSSALLGDGTLQKAKAEFEKKFKDKSGLTWENRLNASKPNKYTFLERNYEESDSEDQDKEDKKIKVDVDEMEERKPVESTLTLPVQQLLTFIFNQQYFLSTMASMSYDAQKLPLGKLSKRTLMAGFQILKDLAELINDPNLATSKYNTSFFSATQDLSNRYFTTIPHVFGRNRPPVLGSGDQIKKEVELLDALTDMGVANEIMKHSKDEDMIHPLDRQFQGLGMEEMTALDHNGIEFKELQCYLNNSRGSTHHFDYKVIDIFRIERKGEHERFMSSEYAKLKNSNRRLLWHGSRSTNFGGILSQGLRIAPPEAPVSGYMFGKGVYFADMSSKSAGYCCSYNSGRMGLLLLCDVELGDPMLELDHGNYNAGEDAKAAGKIATLGRGHSTPAAWKDAGCVHPDLKGVIMPDVSQPAKDGSFASLQYNEYIVYDVAQIRQRYLFHVRMG